MIAEDFIPVWREKFQVRSSDIGYHGSMRVSNLCNYFQEIAGRHAEHLQVGYTYMKASGMAWVLARLAIDIRKFPSWGEEFWLETWPLGTGRIFYRREFRILSGDEMLIAASSYWIPLDMATRRHRIVPLDKSVLKANEGRFGIIGTFEPVPPVNADGSQTIYAKYSDLDQNRHVNNARYVEWVFDQLGVDILDHHIPKFFAIEYRQEVRPGEEVSLRTCRMSNENAYLVEGIIAGSGQVSIRSKISF